jgi:hypothetical protein
MVCSSPPEGRARWTVRLVAEEAGKRKLVPRVGRETIRILLLSHDLKPWRAIRCGSARRADLATLWRLCRAWRCSAGSPDNRQRSGELPGWTSRLSEELTATMSFTDVNSILDGGLSK